MYFFNHHLIRRCHSVAFRTNYSFVEAFLHFFFRLTPMTQKVQCGRFKVYILNLVKGDIQETARKQKKMADIAVRVMENPMLSPKVREVFEKIQVVIIIRGSTQTGFLLNKMFATLNPDLNDLGKSVRRIISYVLWVSKRREEYFLHYRSKEECRAIATAFMNESMREIDVAISEAMEILCDHRGDEANKGDYKLETMSSPQEGPGAGWAQTDSADALRVGSSAGLKQLIYRNENCKVRED